MKTSFAIFFILISTTVVSQIEKPHNFDTLEIYNAKKSKNFHFGINKEVIIKTRRDKFKGTVKAIHKTDLTISLRKSRDAEVTIPFEEIRIIRPLEDYKLVRYLGIALRIFGTEIYIASIMANLFAFWDPLAPERIIACLVGLGGIGIDRLGNWLWGRKFNIKRSWDIAPVDI